MKTESMVTVDKIVALVGGWFNVVAAVIISHLICKVWFLSDYWWEWMINRIIATIVVVAILAGLERLKIKDKTTKMLPRGVAVATILIMSVVAMLYEREAAKLRRDVEPFMREYGQSEIAKVRRGCYEVCKKNYGFDITRPSTWHPFKNSDLERCIRECGPK